MPHGIDDITCAPADGTAIVPAIDESAGPSARLEPHRRWFDVALLLGGLAGVFIVNALVAWLQPGDFVDLIRQSAVSGLLPVGPGRWLAWVIGVNDLVLGLLLVAAIRSRRVRPVVLAWSGVWLLAVTVIKVTALDAFAAT